MRATYLAGLMFLLVPAFTFSQANWTPNLEEHKAQRVTESSPLSGVSVKTVTLSPKEAREHYNIDVPSEQEFVVVESIKIAKTAPDSGYRSPGYGSIKAGDLIDTIVIGGEIPQHGQIKTLADFERFVSLCVPGCIVFVRHRDYGQMSDIIQEGKLYPKFYSGEETHACDSQSHYIYNIHFDPRPGYESENWSGPGPCPTSPCLPPQCYVGGPGIPRLAIPLTESHSVEQEVAAIRNAPHEAMPPAQAARASLGGQTGITVENETNYVLYLYLSGPSSQEITLAAGASQTLQVSPGDYEIAAKVSDPSVIPFYGRDTCIPNTQYSHHFYIATQPR
jgi:hypothetical protein